MRPQALKEGMSRNTSFPAVNGDVNILKDFLPSIVTPIVNDVLLTLLPPRVHLAAVSIDAGEARERKRKTQESENDVRRTSATLAGMLSLLGGDGGPGGLLLPDVLEREK